MRGAGSGCVGGCGRTVAKSGGVEIPGWGDKCCGSAAWCCDRAYFKLVVPLTVMYPDNFCRCVGFEGDVVTYAKFDWNGVDDLENGGIVVALK